MNFQAARHIDSLLRLSKPAALGSASYVALSCARYRPCASQLISCRVMHDPLNATDRALTSPGPWEREVCAGKAEFPLLVTRHERQFLQRRLGIATHRLGYALQHSAVSLFRRATA